MSPTMPASTADDVGGLQFPTGLGPFPYLGSAQPPGWYLVKPGQDFEIENIADYPALAQLVGSRWGGDGITTFAMPQAGVFTRGPDGVHALWGLFGEDAHALTTAEMPTHTHDGSAPLGSGQDMWGLISRATGAGDLTATSGDPSAGEPVVIQPGGLTLVSPLANTGGGAAHNNVPLTLVTNLIVKA